MSTGISLYNQYETTRRHMIIYYFRAVLYVIIKGELYVIKLIKTVTDL